MSAVVRDKIRGKESGLGRRGGLDVRLRASESVARCAKKMKIRVSAVDVWLKRPEPNEDDSHVAKVRHGMKRRERRRCVERRREDIVKGLGVGRHVENRVERRKRKFVRDVCAGDKRGDRKRCG